MAHQSNQPDPIDHALAALRTTAPPEGMETRILQTLDARLAEGTPSPSRWNALMPASSWLRGALTGALAATAACAVLFFALHPNALPATANTRPLQPAAATLVALRAGDQCPGAPLVRSRADASERDEKSARVPHPISTWPGNPPTDVRVPDSSRAVMRDEWAEHSSHAPHLIPASFAPSRPTPPAPPTAQERALIQLVHTATPAQLAALHRSTNEKSDAEREAAFDRFFAPSPDLLAADEAQRKALGISDDEPAAPNSTKEGQL